jgi:hypothetical protein
MPKRVRQYCATFVVTAIAIATGSTVSSTVVAQDDSQRVAEVGLDLFEGEAGMLTADTTSQGFQRFKVDGSYGSAVPIPGTTAVIAVDTIDALFRYDLDTNDLIRASRQLPGAAQLVGLVPSAGGEWVWAVSRPNLGDAQLKVRRFRATDLAFESEFMFDGPYQALAAVPGDEDAVVILAGASLTMYRNGIGLVDRVDDPTFQIFDFEIFANGAGFAATSLGLYGFAVGDSGIVDYEYRAEAPRGFIEAKGPDQFLLNNEVVFDTASLASRPATPFDRAMIDPTLHYRYGEKTFSTTTGEPVAPFRDCEPSFETLSPVGDGWAVSPTLTFANVLDRCGAFGEFTPLAPRRIFDTRPGSGFAGGGVPLGGGAIRRVKVHGLGGVPDTGVDSVVLNVTAVRQRDTGGALNFITVWPAGIDQPTVSSLNVAEGETVGNMVTVATAADGYIDVYSSVGVVDLTVDVFGYFASTVAPAGAVYQPVGPRSLRALDTRLSGQRRLGGGQSIDIDMAPYGRPQSKPIAAVVSVTAIQPSDRGFFKIYPSGGELPDASSMNFGPRTNTNRLVTVTLNNGRFTVLNDVGSTHVTIDIIGYYELRDPSIPMQSLALRFIGVEPFRLADTRVESPFDGDGRVPEQFVYITDGFSPGVTLAANLTAIRPTETGFMSTGPWSDNNVDSVFGLTETSALNFSPGRVVSNQTIFSASRDGSIAVYNSAGLTHFALDVFGFYVSDLGI